MPGSLILPPAALAVKKRNQRRAEAGLSAVGSLLPTRSATSGVSFGATTTHTDASSSSRPRTAPAEPSYQVSVLRPKGEEHSSAAMHERIDGRRRAGKRALARVAAAARDDGAPDDEAVPGCTIQRIIHRDADGRPRTSDGRSGAEVLAARCPWMAPGGAAAVSFDGGSGARSHTSGGRSATLPSGAAARPATSDASGGGGSGGRRKRQPPSMAARTEAVMETLALATCRPEPPARLRSRREQDGHASAGAVASLARGTAGATACGSFEDLVVAVSCASHPYPLLRALVRWSREIRSRMLARGYLSECATKSQ